MRLLNPLTSWLGLTPPTAVLKEDAAARKLLEEHNAKLEHKLRESYMDLDWYRGGYGLGGWGGPYDGGTLDGRYAWGAGYSGGPSDRKGGGSFPVLQTEDDLRRMRSFARHLCDSNVYAIGFWDHVTNFVLGSGFKVEVVMAGQKTGAVSTGEEVDPNVAACQQVWDEFCSINGWGCGDESAVHLERDGDASPPTNREREAYRRLMRDGEFFLRVFVGGGKTNGIPKVRFIPPELVGSPPGEGTQGKWSWGVLTDEDDTETRKAYWRLPLPGTSDKGERIPAGQVIHGKVNVDGEVKRGVSDFFPLDDSLKNTVRTLHAMEVCTGIQASIAYLRQHAPNTTSTQIGTLLSQTTTQGPPTYPSNRPDTQRYLTLQQAGAIIDLSNQLVMAPPPSNPGTPGHIQVVQQTLQAVGLRWGCPQYFGGDSSNANFASTLVSGGPFERATVTRQNEFKVIQQGLAVAVLLAAVRSGRLTEDQVAAVAVKVTAPEVSIANKLEATQRRQILKDGAGLSPQTWLREEGYDPALEISNTKEWREQFPPPDMGQGGEGGGEGDPEGGDGKDGNPGGDDPTPLEDAPTSEGFDPSQPRDKIGRWAGNGGGGAGKKKDGKADRPKRATPQQREDAVRAANDLIDNGVRTPAAGVESELVPLLESQAKLLDITCNPREPDPGDHHFPFGVAALARASDKTGMKYTLARPVEPLPEGTVS